MGQLARRGRYASKGSAECAHHAIWISVAVVWKRGDAAEGINGCTTVAAGIEEGKKGKAQCITHGSSSHIIRNSRFGL